MPSVEENLGWARNEAWEDHGEEWSSGFGDSFLMWHGLIVPRIGRWLPAGLAVEIACGHGRCTRFLASSARELVAVDLAPEIVDACAARLRDRANVRYVVNDGRSLPTVAADSVDLAFSWDSLVHAEADVLDDYLLALAVALRPGGVAFLHHSNLGAYRNPTTGEAEVTGSSHWRGVTATAAGVRATCARLGLECLVQELIPWGGAEFIDCFTLLRRPDAAPREVAPVVHEHAGFLAEAANLRRLRSLYG
jgi:SAM-dependent methyltransferase